MKRNYKKLLVVLCLSVSLFAFKIYNEKPNAIDPAKDKLLLEILTFVIQKEHYSAATIDDMFSKGLYKNYLEALDPSKRFFLKSDIDEFSKYQILLDDQILDKDLTFFNLTFDRLMERMEQSKKIYPVILSKPFEYKADENFETDADKSTYPKNNKELIDKWRKQIKLSTLSSLTDRIKMQEKNKIALKDGGVKQSEIDDPLSTIDSKTKKNTLDNSPPKTYTELEKETRTNALKSMDEYFSFMRDLDKNDYFSIYLSTITNRFDPHTDYFAPQDKERFDVSISGKLEGIGARLQKKNDYTEISELISGGPAWKQKELEAGDLVIKVAQGNREAVDVIGMRLDDVVKKIKGPKGSEVRLTVKKVDGTIKVISIIRDIVEIEETYVKSSIVEKNGLKYGVIYLPKFYIDFENKDGRDAGKDVALEVQRLKKAQVSGIVLDVRDDGGGSLATVVDIAGLFIEQGPIVQVKSSSKKKEILYDTDKKIEWDGPLVIMTNSFSASASEILAAAIQDYKRGIIIGSKQTYGKGTVQNVRDLNQFVRNSSLGDLGAVKTTIQKFYRINGGSTQLEGVSSDVVMPDRYAYLKMGERDIENAMPWDKIDATEYEVWNKNQNFNQAIQNSKKRIAQSPQFSLMEDNAKWVDIRSKETIFSLNMDKFKTAINNLEEKAKKYKPLVNYKNDLKFESLSYELIETSKDEVLKDKRDRWHESLSKDIYVEEALNILDDLQPKSEIAIKKDTFPKPKKDKLANNVLEKKNK